jgi:hypothetical protein
VTATARLAAAMLLAGLSAPLAAQSQGDPVRLDDLAVSSAADQSLQVQQLSTGVDGAAQAPQPRDRTVSTEERAQPAAPSISQVSQRGQRTDQAQLSKTGASPDQSAAAVSSTAESRPEGVERLTGTDRCDPQLGNAERERCQHILELRSQEFHAPAPPQLSAEEKLLAEQHAQEDALNRSPDNRLRLASRDDPDAELKSNQELAALYLGRQAPPPTQSSDQQAPAIDESLVKVLDALQLGITSGQGSTPPQGNP